MSLNDPRWGRDSDESTEEDSNKKPEENREEPPKRPEDEDNESQGKKGKSWRDLNGMTQDEIDKYQEKIEQKLSRILSSIFGFDPSGDESKNRHKMPKIN